MDETSTTATDNLDTTVQDQGATDNQTADTGDNLETNSSTNDQDAGSSDAGATNDDSASTPKFDADLNDWAAKTGRAVPESDRERALYQEIRDSQREFSRSKQAQDASKDILKAIQDAKPADDTQDDGDEGYDDELVKTVAELKAANEQERALRQRSEFFTEKSVTEEQAATMGEILKEKVERGGKAAYDYWTNPANLDDWYDLAKARLLNIDTSALQEEAARQERERIAKESAASGSRRSASTTTPQGNKGYDRTDYFKNN